MYNPAYNQQMAQLDQEEYAKKKAEIMQSFYAQPTPQTQVSAPTQNVNWIYVTGVEGARNHIVQPGNTAWLMDIYITISITQKTLCLSVDSGKRKEQYYV